MKYVNSERGERGAKSAVLGFAQVEHLFKTAGSGEILYLIKVESAVSNKLESVGEEINRVKILSYLPKL
jgi:hypothetical protein